MATRVFISWSGSLSCKLGEVLRDWLPAVLQFVKPYFSPDDLEKGAKWDSEISKELELSDVGVICLTKENVDRPWILFEAGALSKSVEKARVCTLLFDLEPTDVKGPLTGFQATKFERSDFKRLIETINNSAGEGSLGAKVLDDVFDMWWTRLEDKIKEILDSDDNHVESELRSDRDLLEEILNTVRKLFSDGRGSDMLLSEILKRYREANFKVVENLHRKFATIEMSANDILDDLRSSAEEASESLTRAPTDWIIKMSVPTEMPDDD